MSVDAAYQYAQVLGAPRDDIHQPLMMLLWRATEAIIPGPGGLFALFAAAFWGAWARWSRRPRRIPRAPRRGARVGLWPRYC